MKRIFFNTLACILTFWAGSAVSQSISPFREGGKWGFRLEDKVIIEPQYDTVFGFDVRQKIALVANLNPKKNFINPLTREVKKVYDYYYITPENKKISIVTSDKRTVTDFVNQQKFQKEYLLNTGFFKISHENKIYLLDKSGKQITSGGYDNVLFTKCPSFFMTETHDKNGQVYVGLIDENEKQIIPPTYSKIAINMYDSLIICCTAGIKFNGADDVFNYKGEKISSSPRHIDYAFRDYTVYKLYEPRVTFIIYENESKKEKNIEADALFYTKDENIVMKHKDNYFFYNFKTDKKTPFDKKLTSYYNINEQH